MKRILGFLVMVCVFFMTGGCGNKTQKTEQVRYIEAMKVKTSKGQLRRTFSGVSKASIESKLSFRVGGTIDYLGIKVGDRVERGQVLAKLDDTDYRLEYEELKARYQLASANLDRIRNLYETKNASKQDLDDAQSSKQSLQAQLELAKKKLSYNVLTAPFDGSIVSVDVEVHEQVNQASPICEFDSDVGVEVEVGVPEAFIEQVKSGDKVTLFFETTERKVIEGTVIKIGNKIDDKTSTFPVTVEIDNPNSKIRSGMVVDAEFNLGEYDQKIFVPLSSVSESDREDKFVWVYRNQDGTVRKRIVRTGVLNLDTIEIKEGLVSGEIIAIAGMHSLREGQKVKVKQDIM